jgi:hypothetical protein
MRRSGNRRAEYRLRGKYLQVDEAHQVHATMGEAAGKIRAEEHVSDEKQREDH